MSADFCMPVIELNFIYRFNVSDINLYLEFESEILQNIQQIDADFGIDVAQVFVALQHH